MKKLLTLVAAAALGLGTLGCEPKPATPPANTPAPGGESTPPAETPPATEQPPAEPTS